MTRKFWAAAIGLAAFGLAAAPSARAAESPDITIGITISTSGPSAALGVPERNALEFVPAEIGGAKIKTIVLDDAGDPTTATTNARRFVNELAVDIIMGSSNTPASIGVATVAAEAGIPHFALAPTPITPGARQVDRGNAAAGAADGQGAVRSHEEERREDRRHDRLLGFLG